MSIAVMERVWYSSLDPNLKTVLLAYADHADDYGGSIYPFVDTIGTKTSYSRATVQRLTRKLESLGLMKLERAGGEHGRRTANEYAIDLDVLDGYATPRSPRKRGPQYEAPPLPLDLDDDEGPQDEAPGSHLVLEGASSRPRRGLTGEAHNVIEPSEEPPEKRARPRDFLWDAFVAVHGQPGNDAERGRFNRAKWLLAEAEVDPDEYPALVQAIVSKYDGRVQPAPMTVATRVGELRQFLDRGPVVAVEPEDRDWAALHDENDNEEAV